jgi:hypothetical protein
LLKILIYGNNYKKSFLFDQGFIIRRSLSWIRIFYEEE